MPALSEQEAQFLLGAIAVVSRRARRLEEYTELITRIRLLTGRVEDLDRGLRAGIAGNNTFQDLQGVTDAVARCRGEGGLGDLREYVDNGIRYVHRTLDDQPDDRLRQMAQKLDEAADEMWKNCFDSPAAPALRKAFHVFSALVQTLANFQRERVRAEVRELTEYSVRLQARLGGQPDAGE